MGGGAGLERGRVPSGCTSARGALRTRRVQRSGNCSASVMAPSSSSISATFAAAAGPHQQPASYLALLPF